MNSFRYLNLRGASLVIRHDVVFSHCRRYIDKHIHTTERDLIMPSETDVAPMAICGLVGWDWKSWGRAVLRAPLVLTKLKSVLNSNCLCENALYIPVRNSEELRQLLFGHCLPLLRVTMLAAGSYDEVPLLSLSAAHFSSVIIFKNLAQVSLSCHVLPRPVSSAPFADIVLSLSCFPRI